ncbi:substrate-binding domain-containing protein, partial [Asanoa sp. NPDC050611]|uniref:substrate-binding domain-containing protein n=1 Tax=Asanoa sp. NPDC050611 TaxID=3157098 RepID=UPI0033E0A18E
GGPPRPGRRSARSCRRAAAGRARGRGAGVLDATRTVGLSVPDDVAISGFDDRSLAAHTQPALTTVRMPLQETGHAAAHMLFAMLGDEPLTTRRMVLPTEVIIRDSTPRAR